MPVIGHSATNDVAARKASFNTDPRTLYGATGKAPAGRMTNRGVAVQARVGSTTSGSATVTFADTEYLEVGMVASGAGLSAGQAATTQNTGDTFTITSHGAPNGTPVYLTALGTTTGFSLNRIYYVVSTAANTFQLAATPGGSAIAVDADGTATVVFQRFVTAVTTDTSVTLNIPASATAADTPVTFHRPTAMF